MSTAKKNIRIPLASKVLPFTKKNVLALADRIFSSKNGEVKVLKLCDGTLSNGKDGKRTLHCAVGELYYNFVTPAMDSIMRGNSDDLAVEVLVTKAKLKTNTPQNQTRLTNALNHCISANDRDPGDEVSDYLERAERVADVLRDEVAPLLK